MQDIIERLDAELRTVPAAGFEIEQAVRTGRTAVRRRRAALGGAGLAAVLAVGGLAWAVGPGGDRGTDDSRVAVSPTPTPSPLAPSPTPVSEPWEKGELVRVDAEGTVTVNPAAEVLVRSQVTGPDGTVHQTFRLRLDGRDYYAMADDAGYTSSPFPAQGLSLREWARRSLTGGGSESSDDRSWVRIDGRSRVRPEPGVEVVSSRPDPGLGDRFAPAGQPTAVAEVVRDGVTWFLAVRRLPGGATEAIPYRKDATVPTLSAFLAYVRTQYATNESGGSEGLR